VMRSGLDELVAAAVAREMEAGGRLTAFFRPLTGR